MADSDPAAPLAATLRRVSALSPYLSAETGAIAAGWFGAADLARAGAPPLAAGLAGSVVYYPGAEQRVAGSFFIGHYVWYLAGVAIGCYLAERRVPDLAAANVALRYRIHSGDDGASYQDDSFDVRFLSGRVALLADDPAADHADALILPDEAALRSWLRSRLEEHLTPLIDALHGATRLSRRAQWNLAADSCARLFQWVGHVLGDEERGCAEGIAFIKAAGSLLLNPHTGFIKLEYMGRQETFCTRGGCCLYHKVSGGEKCDGCVLREPHERNQLFLREMARAHEEQVGA